MVQYGLNRIVKMLKLQFAPRELSKNPNRNAKIKNHVLQNDPVRAVFAVYGVWWSPPNFRWNILCPPLKIQIIPITLILVTSISVSDYLLNLIPSDLIPDYHTNRRQRWSFDGYHLLKLLPLIFAESNNGRSSTLSIYLEYRFKFLLRYK